jgi:AcrR family transcriptional regulator
MTAIKNKKDDKRSKYTQMVVKNALLDLLKEKPLNQIGVTEICTKAEVNRGTFYNHFFDVENVLECIEGDFIDKLNIKLSAMANNGINNNFLNDMLSFVEENADFIKLLLYNKRDSDFLNKIIAIGKKHTVTELSKLNKTPTIPIGTIVTFSLYGGIGVISDWLLSNNKQTAMEIGEKISQFNDLIYKEFL